MGYSKILKGIEPARMGNGIAPSPPIEDPEELKKRRARSAYALRNGLQEVPVDQASLFGGDLVQKWNPDQPRGWDGKFIGTGEGEVARNAKNHEQSSKSHMEAAAHKDSHFVHPDERSAHQHAAILHKEAMYAHFASITSKQDHDAEVAAGATLRAREASKQANAYAAKIQKAAELDAALRMGLRSEIRKYNENHDSLGRFAESPGGGALSTDKNELAKQFDGHSNAADYAAAFHKEVPESEVLAGLITAERARYDRVQAEVNQAIAEGKVTHKMYSTEPGKASEEINPKDPLQAYSPERQAVHDKILGDLFKNADKYKPADGEAPTMVMLGGRGGSGKSSFEGMVYDRSNTMVLDADYIKTQLPGYDNEKPWLYHEESSQIFNEAVNRARDRGLNVALDVTMGSKSAVRRMDEFNAAGYQTEAHYMHLPAHEASRRALMRWARPSKGEPFSGRLVAPQIIMGMKTNEKIFDEAKAKANHGWSFWDNQHGPRKVAHG